MPELSPECTASPASPAPPPIPPNSPPVPPEPPQREPVPPAGDPPLNFRLSDPPTERMRRALYDRLVSINSEPDPAEPGPPFDPDAAGLVVFHAHGRWFATWLDLSLPADWPEHQRRQVVTIHPGDSPSGIFLHEV